MSLNYKLKMHIPTPLGYAPPKYVISYTLSYSDPSRKIHFRDELAMFTQADSALLGAGGEGEGKLTPACRQNVTLE